MLGDAGDRPPWFAIEADIVDADQFDAGEQQVVFPFAVGLEGAGRTVGRVDVEFDREALRLPVESSS
jgi:hypothetical protein